MKHNIFNRVITFINLNNYYHEKNNHRRLDRESTKITFTIQLFFMMIKPRNIIQARLSSSTVRNKIEKIKIKKSLGLLEKINNKIIVYNS